MIGILLDDDTEFLDTAPDTVIDMVLENPFLGDDDDKLSPGSYTLPFNLPAGKSSPKNSAKLKHPDVLENNAGYQVQGARLFFKNIPFKSGTLKARSVSGNVVESNFSFGLNSLNPDLKTARIRDLVNNNIVISNA